MEPTLLQLFTLRELIERLAEKGVSGCLHVFTTRESANLFFQKGVIIAAAKGLIEGEDVVKEVLGWTDARATWQSETFAGSQPFKPLKINVAQFLQPKVSVPESEATPAAAPASDRPLVILGAAKPAAVSLAPAVLKPLIQSTAPLSMTATKTITSTSQLRFAQEKALLEKHQISLLSVDNPEQREKISRASTLVGRNPACDLTLDHGSVSRQHCLLQLTDRGLHVKDLGTTNGTKVNGISLTEGYVSIGDKLTIGHLTFVVKKD